MAIVTNPVVTINGVSLNTSELEAYTLTYAKLWKDADRNMNGELSSTLIGVFPNISVTTTVLDPSKAQSLSQAANDAYFSVTFWDTSTGTSKTADFYAADHDVSLLSECKYGQVILELVPVRKANYI